MLTISEPPRRSRAFEELRRITLGLLCLAIPLSFALLHPALMGGGSDLRYGFRPGTQGAGPQEIVVVGAWCLILVSSYLPRDRLATGLTGLELPVLLLAVAALSPLWSAGADQSSMMKSAALVLCSLGVWRAASLVTIAEFFTITRYSLLILVLASIVFVVIAPDLALSHYWQQTGMWQGVFDQKQSLGICAACLVFFSLLRLMRQPNWVDALGLAAGLICVVNSGSRGGAIVAAVSALSVIGLQRRRLVAPIVLLIGIDLALAVLMMGYMAVVGEDYITLFGFRLDFDGRTPLWNFAVGAWADNRPLLGYGLNGFWSQPDIYFAFLRRHRWVLTDYHDGYLAVLVETGLLGFALFCGIVVRLCRRLITLLREDRRNYEYQAAAGFLIMVFTSNLTEAYFLRSTNFLQLASTFLAIKLLGSKVAVGARPAF